MHIKFNLIHTISCRNTIWKINQLPEYQRISTKIRNIPRSPSLPSPSLSKRMVSSINNTSNVSTLQFSHPLIIPRPSSCSWKKGKKNPKRALEQTVHHLPSADWNNRGCQPFSQQIRTRRTPPFCSPPPPPPPRPLSPTTCVEKNEAFYTRDSLISPLPSCPFNQIQPSTFAETPSGNTVLSRFNEAQTYFHPRWKSRGQIGFGHTALGPSARTPLNYVVRGKPRSGQGRIFGGWEGARDY